MYPFYGRRVFVAQMLVQPALERLITGQEHEREAAAR